MTFFTFFLHSSLEALPQSTISALVPFVFVHDARSVKPAFWELNCNFFLNFLHSNEHKIIAILKSVDTVIENIWYQYSNMKLWKICNFVIFIQIICTKRTHLNFTIYLENQFLELKTWNLILECWRLKHVFNSNELVVIQKSRFIC